MRAWGVLEIRESGMSRSRSKPADLIVGKNIRIYRIKSQLSQTALADRIGVTFQQVQKYEKGTNRVGASRLVQIANVLKVPITTLFEGVDRPVTEGTKSPQDLLADNYALKLLQGFGDIADRGVRSALVQLVTHIAQKGR
jgi:transcriptional regulator with XRE-family HTH domain